MPRELFDLDEAKQLKSQIIVYAEDKRQFSQTEEELIIPPKEYCKRCSHIDQPI